MGRGEAVTLINRDFVVDAPLRLAWQHLSEVERWPSWASHIRRVEFDPEGVHDAGSAGRFHLASGVSSGTKLEMGWFTTIIGSKQSMIAGQG